MEAIPNIFAKFYSAIAAKSPIIKDLYRDVAQEVSLALSGGRILDVGTGPGYLPIEIAKKLPTIEVRGIDLSPEMVDIANKNAQDCGLSERVKFQLASAESLPFGNGYFDLVVSTASFHHWLNPAKCLNEIRRVLKENGQAWIYDIRKDTPKEVEGELKKKYGWFLSFLFLKIVRLHSAVTLKRVREVISLPEVEFSRKDIVEDKGLFLKLQLLK